MDIETIRETVSISFSDRIGDISFVIHSLGSIGVVRYSCDLCSVSTVYYDSSGSSISLPNPTFKRSVAFSTDKSVVSSANLLLCSKKIGHDGFLSLIANAGICLYVVYINTRTILYLGYDGVVCTESIKCD